MEEQSALMYNSFCKLPDPHKLVCRLQHVISCAKACCTAAAELHGAGLVHRDFRLSNVVRSDRSEGSYIVIDMERAGRAGLVWNLEPLQDWDDAVLDEVALGSCRLLSLHRCPVALQVDVELIFMHVS
jgi:serine/threonine protein kinase